MTTLFTVEQHGNELYWTLQELSSSSALQPDFIVECVELGLVEVEGQQAQWRFNNDCRLRLQKAWRLHRDLEVHTSALPLLLEMIDELSELRQEAEKLRARLRHWELVHLDDSGS